MTSTTPDDIAAALAGWLTERLGEPVIVIGPPTSNGAGFDSAIHFVQFVGPSLPIIWQQPLVVRVKPRLDGLDDAHREAAFHGWLADQGYPVPRVLEVFEPGVIAPLPAQVIVRAPGVVLADAITRQPWTLRRQMRQLAALHAQLHQLPTAGFPVADDLVDRRLRLPRRLADELGDAALARALEQVEPLVPRLRDAPPSVCHGDFHPLNVLVDGEFASVIDWSDAGVGDRHGDVARTGLLLELAAVATTNRAERALLGVAGPAMSRTYRRAYEELLPCDPARLALWRPAHLLHGWAQALGARAGIFDQGELATRLPAGLVDELQRRFTDAVAAV